MNVGLVQRSLVSEESQVQRHVMFPMNTTAGTCCICLTEYSENDTPFDLSCGHCVHSDCMLRLCLNGGASVRCPYCRASLVVDDEDSGESDDDFESDVVIGESVPHIEEGPLLPQWMRVQWQLLATGRSLRVQEGVVKKLLNRASSKRAPDILKRCANEQKVLQKDLVQARVVVKQSKRGKPCKTVRETLRLLKHKEDQVHKAERRLHAHKKNVLLRCQKSQNVVNYLWFHPLGEVT